MDKGTLQLSLKSPKINIKNAEEKKEIDDSGCGILDLDDIPSPCTNKSCTCKLYYIIV